jgi:hypothetical protein
MMDYQRFGSLCLSPILNLFILHPSFFILYPSSFILYPSSFILYPSSFILHPLSFILYPSSCCSFILYPSSCCSFILLLLPKLLGKGNGGMNRGFGLTSKGHTCFLRSAIAFAGVAAIARCNHVIPGMSTASRSGQDVVYGQVAGAAAVLAGVIVAPQYLASVNGGHLPESLWIGNGEANVFWDSHH